MLDKNNPDNASCLDKKLGTSNTKRTLHYLEDTATGRIHLSKHLQKKLGRPVKNKVELGEVLLSLWIKTELHKFRDHGIKLMTEKNKTNNQTIKE